MRTISSTVLLLLFFIGTGLSQDIAKKKTKTIRGTVVAESTSNRFQSCWHVCGLGLIVKLEGSGTSEYAVVSVTFMDDRHLPEKGLHWKLVEESKRWKFTTSAGDPSTVILKEYLTAYNLETREDITEKTKINQWLPVKGAENVKLPYGQSIPSYDVEVGEFEAIK